MTQTVHLKARSDEERVIGLKVGVPNGLILRADFGSTLVGVISSTLGGETLFRMAVSLCMAFVYPSFFLVAGWYFDAQVVHSLACTV